MGYISNGTQTAGAGTTQAVNLTQVGGSAISLGQALMVSSLPVVIASNQSAIPVSQSGTWTVAISAGSAVIGHVITDSGSVTSASQSGTWNITNISGTVSLPTGASTAAKQPALGTAGTASADVITVQGIAGMTKLLVTPDALPANQSVNVAQINGVTPLMGNGVTGTGSQRVTIASDNTAFSVNAIQSGTWTVQPGNTANTTPWLVKPHDGTNALFSAAAALADATSNPTIGGIQTFLMGFNGTTWDRLQVDASKFLKVNVAAALPTGTNSIGNIGTVSTVSTVSNLSQIASTTPTFTSQALDVNIKSETAPAVSLTRVAIAASSSGDNTLISAVSAKKIYVVAFELSFSGTVNAKFTDGASGTSLGGLYYGVANAGAANSISPDMLFATPSPYLWVGSTNTALILNLSTNVAVGGAVTYFTV